MMKDRIHHGDRVGRQALAALINSGCIAGRISQGARAGTPYIRKVFLHAPCVGAFGQLSKLLLPLRVLRASVVKSEPNL